MGGGTHTQSFAHTSKTTRRGTPKMHDACPATPGLAHHERRLSRHHTIVVDNHNQLEWSPHDHVASRAAQSRAPTPRAHLPTAAKVRCGGACVCIFGVSGLGGFASVRSASPVTLANSPVCCCIGDTVDGVRFSVGSVPSALRTRPRGVGNVALCFQFFLFGSSRRRPPQPSRVVARSV